MSCPIIATLRTHAALHKAQTGIGSMHDLPATRWNHNENRSSDEWRSPGAVLASMNARVAEADPTEDYERWDGMA
jgi:hypothetical protein